MWLTLLPRGCRRNWRKSSQKNRILQGEVARLRSERGKIAGCDMAAARQKLIQEYDMVLRSTVVNSVAKALNKVDSGATPVTPNINQLLLAPQGPAGRGSTGHGIGEDQSRMPKAVSS